MEELDPAAFARLSAESLQLVAYLASRAFDGIAQAKIDAGVGEAVESAADVLKTLAAKALGEDAQARVGVTLEALVAKAKADAPVEEIRAAAAEVLASFGFALGEEQST